jgi:hypothetical protein
MLPSLSPRTAALQQQGNGSNPAALVNKLAANVGNVHNAEIDNLLASSSSSARRARDKEKDKKSTKKKKRKGDKGGGGGADDAEGDTAEPTKADSAGAQLRGVVELPPGVTAEPEEAEDGAHDEDDKYDEDAFESAPNSVPPSRQGGGSGAVGIAATTNAAPAPVPAVASTSTTTTTAAASPKAAAKASPVKPLVLPVAAVAALAPVPMEQEEKVSPVTTVPVDASTAEDAPTVRSPTASARSTTRRSVQPNNGATGASTGGASTVRSPASARAKQQQPTAQSQSAASTPRSRGSAGAKATKKPAASSAATTSSAVARKPSAAPSASGRGVGAKAAAAAAHPSAATAASPRTGGTGAKAKPPAAAAPNAKKTEAVNSSVGTVAATAAAEGEDDYSADNDWRNSTTKKNNSDGGALALNDLAEQQLRFTLLPQSLDNLYATSSPTKLRGKQQQPQPQQAPRRTVVDFCRTHRVAHSSAADAAAPPLSPKGAKQWVSVYSTVLSSTGAPAAASISSSSSSSSSVFSVPAATLLGDDRAGGGLDDDLVVQFWAEGGSGSSNSNSGCNKPKQMMSPVGVSAAARNEARAERADYHDDDAGSDEPFKRALLLAEFTTSLRALQEQAAADASTSADHPLQRTLKSSTPASPKAAPRSALKASPTPLGGGCTVSGVAPPRAPLHVRFFDRVEVFALSARLDATVQLPSLSSEQEQPVASVEAPVPTPFEEKTNGPAVLLAGSGTARRASPVVVVAAAASVSAPTAAPPSSARQVGKPAAAASGGATIVSKKTAVAGAKAANSRTAAR